MRKNGDQREETSSFLTQIVFPISDTLLSFKSHAFLVGWNIENFRCCIIAAFEVPSDRYLEVQDAIARTYEPLSSVYATCSPNGLALPTILGGNCPIFSALCILIHSLTIS
jgi:hypothetical protein